MSERDKHNKRVKVTAVIMAIIALVSGMALDSGSWLPVITLGISLVWLYLFMIANCRE